LSVPEEAWNVRLRLGPGGKLMPSSTYAVSDAVPVASERHEQRIRAFTGLVNRVPGFLVQQNGGVVTDMDVDVAEGSIERCIAS